MLSRPLHRRAFVRVVGGFLAAAATAFLPGTAGRARAAGRLGKWECTNDQCEPFVYDPEIGVPDFDIPPGIPFEDLPEDWICPICGNAKWEFERLE